MTRWQLCQQQRHQTGFRRRTRRLFDDLHPHWHCGNNKTMCSAKAARKVGKDRTKSKGGAGTQTRLPPVSCCRAVCQSAEGPRTVVPHITWFTCNGQSPVVGAPEPSQLSPSVPHCCSWKWRSTARTKETSALKYLDVWCMCLVLSSFCPPTPSPLLLLLYPAGRQQEVLHTWARSCSL